MPTPFTDRYRDLHRMVEALPVSAFTGDDTFGDWAARVFGPGTSVAPMIHCAHLGTWVSGWTVVTALPEGDGVATLSVDMVDDWATMRRGRRVDLLTSSAKWSRWAGADVTASCLSATDEMASEYAEGARFEWDYFGVLNNHRAAWTAAHLRNLLDAEQREGFDFMLSLKYPAEQVAHVRLAMERVNNVAANQHLSDKAEEAIVSAVHRKWGVTIRGAEVEALGVAGALIPLRLTTWPTEADRLVVAAVERGDASDITNLQNAVDGKPARRSPPAKARTTGWGALAV